MNQNGTHDDLLMGSEQFCEYANLRTSRRLRTQEGVWAIVQKCTNFEIQNIKTPGAVLSNLCFFHRTRLRGRGDHKGVIGPSFLSGHRSILVLVAS